MPSTPHMVHRGHPHLHIPGGEVCMGFSLCGNVRSSKLCQFFHAFLGAHANFPTHTCVTLLSPPPPPPVLAFMLVREKGAFALVRGAWTFVPVRGKRGLCVAVTDMLNASKRPVLGVGLVCQGGWCLGGRLAPSLNPHCSTPLPSGPMGWCGMYEG